MKILVIVLIIIIISLSAFWQEKKLVDLHVYDSILAEKSFYFEKQNEWFQYHLDGKHRKVAFPNKFQAITALNYDNEVIWIGTTEKSEDSIFLAEYNSKNNECTILCSENDLKAQGLELSTITEFHFQPKTKNLSFLSGNDLYLYNRKEKNAMSEIVKTMKLHIHVNETEAKSLDELTACYAQACTFISKYVFDHGFILNFMKLQETLYQTIRTEFGLKSQFTISAFKTVTARQY